MIWHIFRKDARLLWPGAVLIAALQVCAAVPHYLVDHGARTVQLMILGILLSALALLGAMAVVVVAIHQDPVPGARQDWLIRPIRRRDLALAKLLFVVLMVQLPIWLVDVGIALVDGFGLPAACIAATGRNIAIFCQYTLPAVMIGVVTGTFVEALIFSAVALVAYIGLFYVVLSLLLGVKATVGETGAAWIVTAVFYLLALPGAALVLPLQYRGRRTALARGLIVLGGALVIGAAFVPWHLAFSIQAALSAEPAAARAVAVAFDPQAGRYQLPLGAAPAVTSALHLPLRLSGLPVDSMVLLDRADVRITALDGTTLYRGKTNISVDGLGSMHDAQFEARSGRSDAPTHSLYQRIYLPTTVYARLANRQVRLSIDYSLTLFRTAHNFSLPATGARETLPGLGRCATAIDADGDDVAIGCLSTARQNSCFAAHLEDPATGLRNPEVNVCQPDYAPAFMTQFWPDTINRMGGELRFFDRSGLVHFPVDGSKLAGAKLMITTFEPRDHFTRHVDTPIVRLADFSGVAAAAAVPAPAAPPTGATAPAITPPPRG